jgi:hypothetical protein
VLELQWLLGKKALDEPRSFPNAPSLTVTTVKPDSRLGTGDPEVHLHLVAVGGQRTD